jgi:hypothetical protein
MKSNLERTRDLVALEAYSVSDLGGLVRKVFPSIKTGLHNLVGMFGQGHDKVGLTSNQHDFMKVLNHKQYVDLMPLTAYVPEGLAVSYLEYDRELRPMVERACLVMSVLNPYSTWLALMAHSNEALLDTKSHAREYEKLAQERDALTRRVAACFKAGSTRTEAKLSDVIHRNSDWPAVFKATDAMSVEINKIDRKALDKKLNECVELIDAIGRKIERGDFEDVTPEAVMGLSDGAYHVAQELEFFSATYYRVLAFTTAVDRSLKHVVTVYKDNPDLKAA